MVWYGMVWYGMVWHGMVWYGNNLFDITEIHNTLVLTHNGSLIKIMTCLETTLRIQ